MECSCHLSPLSLAVIKPEMLQKATVELLDQALCASLYGHSLTDRMVCAGYLDGKVDSCQVSPSATEAPGKGPPADVGWERTPGFLPRTPFSPEVSGPPPGVPSLIFSIALDFLPCIFFALISKACWIGKSWKETATFDQVAISKPEPGENLGK